jgi:hypothetical protein
MQGKTYSYWVVETVLSEDGAPYDTIDHYIERGVDRPYEHSYGEFSESVVAGPFPNNVEAAKWIDEWENEHPNFLHLTN